jgi:hypothetical protein
MNATHTPIDALSLTDALDAVGSAREAVHALTVLLATLQSDTEQVTPTHIVKRRAAALACMGARLCESATLSLDTARTDLLTAGVTPTQVEAR